MTVKDKNGDVITQGDAVYICRKTPEEDTNTFTTGVVTKCTDLPTCLDEGYWVEVREANDSKENLFMSYMLEKMP